jgi:hypothetical protein
VQNKQAILDDGRKYILNKDYDSTIDIISAYKSLKQAISKPATVHGGGNMNQNKGYLKMTIAATQHSKSKMAKDLLEYSLATSKMQIIIRVIFIE